MHVMMYRFGSCCFLFHVSDQLLFCILLAVQSYVWLATTLSHHDAKCSDALAASRRVLRGKAVQRYGNSRQRMKGWKCSAFLSLTHTDTLYKWQGKPRPPSHH
jgi:hypothetical protein